MSIYPSLRLILRFGILSLMLSTLLFSRAEGQGLPATIRIGLQSAQATVRLSGTAPFFVAAVGTNNLPLAAGSVVVCKPNGGGISITDADGKALLEAPAKLTVLLDPNPPADAIVDPATQPAIRLLGPTRHYDGKADRPYRGSFELIARADGLTVVNIVPFEAYLWGVVSSEMSPRYPSEALKAQAIAARTYAARNLNRRGALGFDLDDTAACQVYGGVPSEDPRTTKAVNDTAGMVLTYDGKLIDAVYSSTCGGYTESAEQAWGRAVPYLQSVADFAPGTAAPFTPKPTNEEGWAAIFKTNRGLNCLQPKWANPEAFRWVKLLTRKEVEAALGQNDNLGAIQNLTVLKRGDSGRITQLKVDGAASAVTLEGELKIRRALGELRSSAFTVDIYRDDAGTPVVFAFWGGGWGHGLGMCQVGAVGMAENGLPYDTILTYYYAGVKIEAW